MKAFGHAAGSAKLLMGRDLSAAAPPRGSIGPGDFRTSAPDQLLHCLELPKPSEPERGLEKLGGLLYDRILVTRSAGEARVQPAGGLLVREAWSQAKASVVGSTSWQCSEPFYSRLAHE